MIKVFIFKNNKMVIEAGILKNHYNPPLSYNVNIYNRQYLNCEGIDVIDIRNDRVIIKDILWQGNTSAALKIAIDNFFAEEEANGFGLTKYILIQADVTLGIASGTRSAIFDGTDGKYDWRGFEMFPERIGQGTMKKDVDYSWNKQTGEFMLLQSMDRFQWQEYFNCILEKLYSI